MLFRSRIDTILGTIAGDDTIFIVIDEKATAEEVKSSLVYVIPDIK